MAINIQNIVAALEAKVAAATSTTETQELIVIIKSIKAAGEQMLASYASVSFLPTATLSNAGNLAYVADVTKIYYSNGSNWVEIGSGSSSGGGSGGTAYDQSLNTTDDVVFNSGLIGNVTIIDNIIGAVNSYGLTDELIISAPLTVNAETTVGSASHVQIDTYKSVYFNGVAGGNLLTIQEPTGANATKFVELSQQPLGTEFTVPNMMNVNDYGTYNLKFTPTSVQLMYDSYSPSVVIGISFVIPALYVAAAGVDVYTTVANGFFNDVMIPNLPIAYSSIAQSTVTPFAANSAGVEFTQVNSTEDVTLTIDGRQTNITHYTSADIYATSMYIDMNSDNLVFSMVDLGDSIISSFKAGDVLVFKRDMPPYADYSVTLTSPFTYSTMSMGYTAKVAEFNSSSMQSVSFQPNNFYLHRSSGKLNDYTFGVDGALCVPEVIADSALIGDVSIIGNTIGAVDSYGLPGSLNVDATDVVFDSSVNFKVNSLNSTTVTVSPGGASQFAFGNTGTGTVFRNMSASQSWTDASYFKTGSIVTLSDMMYGTIVIKLTSDFVYTMMDGWTATYTTISGSPTGNYSSATVENTTGSLVEYGLGGDGIFTAPTVSTNTLLVNGAEAGLLVTNVDDSKSVLVPKQISTTHSGLYWMFAEWVGSMSGGKKVRIETSASTTVNLIMSLVVGDKVTFNANPSGQYTVTVAKAPYFDNMSMAYIIETVETNNAMMSIGFSYTNGIIVESIGVGEINFSNGQIIAEGALLGDVSIIGNTIGAVDSYGVPGTLVVDGDLKVTGDTITSPNDLTVSLGGGTTTYQFTYDMMIGQQFVWNGNTIIAASMSQDAQALQFLLSMNPGDTLAINNPMYGNQTVHLTTKFSLNGTDYEALVVESNMYGMYQTSASAVTGTSTIPVSNFELTTAGNLSIDNQLKIGTYGVDSSVADVSKANFSTSSNYDAVSSTYVKRVSLDSNNSYLTVDNHSEQFHVADGTHIEHITVSKVTGGASNSTATMQIGAPLLGDVTIYEMILTAIATDNTGFIAYKSWKLKYVSYTQPGSMLPLDTTLFPIGNPEILIDFGNTTGLTPVFYVQSGFTYPTLELNTNGSDEFVWGGEIKMITTHKYMPLSGGGGK